MPKAVVQGLEGTLNVPVSERLPEQQRHLHDRKPEQEHRRLPLGDPKFTLKSPLSWQATQDLSIQSTLTWYGRQKPKKYNYQGKPLTGSEKHEVSPYAIVGASASDGLTKNVSVTAGIENLFDKRQFRAGNAQNTGNPTTGLINIAGAGAATNNEPGRTYYLSINSHFR